MKVEIDWLSDRMQVITKHICNRDPDTSNNNFVLVITPEVCNLLSYICNLHI